MWKGLALHTWTLGSTPLAEVLRVARATGWDAVELRHLDFRRGAQAGRSAEQALDLVRASGLAVACVGVERGWMFAEGAERDRLLGAFVESCRWAHALQCDTIMSAVDAGRGQRAQAVASIAEAADTAAAHGVKLALEFISQAEQFNTLERLRDVVSQAAHAHCGLVFDTYHFQRSGDDIRTLEALNPGEILYVQYSDVPVQGGESGDTLDRLPPGRGSVPFPEIFNMLRDRYDGFLSYEAPNPAAWALPPEQASLEALQATRTLLQRL